MYRMREKSLSPIPVLLHELGHLLHIRETGAMDQVPSSFVTYLRCLEFSLMPLRSRNCKMFLQTLSYWQ